MKDIILAATALLLLLVAIAIGTAVGSKKSVVVPPPEVLMTASEPRSPKWPGVRAKWIKDHSECAACGQKDHLQAHHVIPFSVNPDLELSESNLITLCVDGPGGMSCHLLFGHAGRWDCHNPNVIRDAERFRNMLKERSCND